MTKKIRLGLRELDIETKVRKAYDYAKKISSSSFFRSPDPSPDEIISAAGKLEVKNNEAQRTKMTIAEIKKELKSLESELDKKLTQLASYVESRAHENEDIIKSVGMELRNDPMPIGVPGKVSFLSVTAMENAGEIKLRWERVKGAKIFNIEISRDIKHEVKWKPIESTTKTKIILKDLVSGTKYWFRIQAIGAGGKGPYSDPVSKFAP